MHLPPLRSLRCFEAVARLGSVTAAAAELNITHSAVSQQLRQLEAGLDKTLLLRKGRGLGLSENGRLYALQVRTILQDLEEATRLVRSRAEGDELLVATLPSFGLHWLMPRLPRFQVLWPGLRVRLQVSLELAAIEQGAADVGIRMGRGQWKGLEQLRLFDDEWVVVASPEFNGGRLPRNARELVRMPLIRSDESWQGWCEAVGVEPPALKGGGLWINDSNLVIEAVRRGQGLALERLSLVDAHLKDGTLVLASPIGVAYPYPYWLVWPQHAAPDRLAPFRQWLLEEIRTYVAGRHSTEKMRL